MKRLLLVLLVGGMVLLAGCNPAQLRPYGIQGYRLYTDWIAASPYWPEGTPRLTIEQKLAFAEASWAEHERVYNWVEQNINKE